MRKYVLTDPNGLTPAGHRLQPGKFIEQTRAGKDLLQRLGGCCGDTALAAVLISPYSARPGARLFQINCWKVGVDANDEQSYTVVKEVEPVPAVTLEQKIRLALLALISVYKQNDFTRWAQAWLAGEDRSLSSAQAQRALIEKEIEASEGLETLAAWGEAGSGDAGFAERMTRLAQAARHVVHAAELAAGSPPETERASGELARAFAQLCQDNRLDLAALAEEAVGQAVSSAPERAAGR